MVEVEEYFSFNTSGFRLKVQKGNFLKIVRKPPKRSFIILKNLKKRKSSEKGVQTLPL